MASRNKTHVRKKCSSLRLLVVAISLIWVLPGAPSEKGHSYCEWLMRVLPNWGQFISFKTRSGGVVAGAFVGYQLSGGTSYLELSGGINRIQRVYFQDIEINSLELKNATLLKPYLRTYLENKQLDSRGSEVIGTGEEDSYYQVEPVRVLPAALRVLDHYVKREKIPPVMPSQHFSKWENKIEESTLEHALGWTAALLDQSRPISSTSRWKRGSDISRNRSVVQEINIDGIQYVYRPFGKMQGTQAKPDNLRVLNGARKTWLAVNLNRGLGLHSIPHGKLIQIDGTIGILSEFVQGEIAYRGFIDESLRNGLITENSFSDTAAFEFLAGNGDVSFFNFLIMDRQIIVYDHGNAFDTGIPYFTTNADHWGETIFGSHLPTRYTRTFVSNLNRLTPEILQEKYSRFLTDLEFASLLFRRAVILEDIRRRQPELL
jgi:hypothetical protein